MGELNSASDSGAPIPAKPNAPGIKPGDKTGAGTDNPTGGARIPDPAGPARAEFLATDLTTVRKIRNAGDPPDGTVVPMDDPGKAKVPPSPLEVKVQPQGTGTPAPEEHVGPPQPNINAADFIAGTTSSQITPIADLKIPLSTNVDANAFLQTNQGTPAAPLDNTGTIAATPTGSPVHIDASAFLQGTTVTIPPAGGANVEAVTAMIAPTGAVNVDAAAFLQGGTTSQPLVAKVDQPVTLSPTGAINVDAANFLQGGTTPQPLIAKVDQPVTLSPTGAGGNVDATALLQGHSQIAQLQPATKDLTITPSPAGAVNIDAAAFLQSGTTPQPLIAKVDQPVTLSPTGAGGNVNAAAFLQGHSQIAQNLPAAKDFPVSTSPIGAVNIDAAAFLQGGTRPQVLTAKIDQPVIISPAGAGGYVDAAAFLQGHSQIAQLQPATKDLTIAPSPAGAVNLDAAAFLQSGTTPQPLIAKVDQPVTLSPNGAGGNVDAAAFLQGHSQIAQLQPAAVSTQGGATNIDAANFLRANQITPAQVGSVDAANFLHTNTGSSNSFIPVNFQIGADGTGSNLSSIGSAPTGNGMMRNLYEAVLNQPVTPAKFEIPTGTNVNGTSTTATLDAQSGTVAGSPTGGSLPIRNLYEAALSQPQGPSFAAPASQIIQPSTVADTTHSGSQTGSPLPIRNLYEAALSQPQGPSLATPASQIIQPSTVADTTNSGSPASGSLPIRNLYEAVLSQPQGPSFAVPASQSFQSSTVADTTNSGSPAGGSLPIRNLYEAVLSQPQGPSSQSFQISGNGNAAGTDGGTASIGQNAIIPAVYQNTAFGANPAFVQTDFSATTINSNDWSSTNLGKTYTTKSVGAFEQGLSPGSSQVAEVQPPPTPAIPITRLTPAPSEAPVQLALNQNQSTTLGAPAPLFQTHLNGSTGAGDWTSIQQGQTYSSSTGTAYSDLQQRTLGDRQIAEVHDPGSGYQPSTTLASTSVFNHADSPTQPTSNQGLYAALSTPLAPIPASFSAVTGSSETVQTSQTVNSRAGFVFSQLSASDAALPANRSQAILADNYPSNTFLKAGPNDAGGSSASTQVSFNPSTGTSDLLQSRQVASLAPASSAFSELSRTSSDVSRTPADLYTTASSMPSQLASLNRSVYDVQYLRPNQSATPADLTSVKNNPIVAYSPTDSRITTAFNTVDSRAAISGRGVADANSTAVASLPTVLNANQILARTSNATDLSQGTVSAFNASQLPNRIVGATDLPPGTVSALNASQLPNRIVSATDLPPGTVSALNASQLPNRIVGATDLSQGPISAMPLAGAKLNILDANSSGAISATDISKTNAALAANPAGQQAISISGGFIRINPDGSLFTAGDKNATSKLIPNALDIKNALTSDATITPNIQSKIEAINIANIANKIEQVHVVQDAVPARLVAPGTVIETSTTRVIGDLQPAPLRIINPTSTGTILVQFDPTVRVIPQDISTRFLPPDICIPVTLVDGSIKGLGTKGEQIDVVGPRVGNATISINGTSITLIVLPDKFGVVSTDIVGVAGAIKAGDKKTVDEVIASNTLIVKKGVKVLDSDEEVKQPQILPNALGLPPLGISTATTTGTSSTGVQQDPHIDPHTGLPIPDPANTPVSNAIITIALNSLPTVELFDPSGNTKFVVNATGVPVRLDNQDIANIAASRHDFSPIDPGIPLNFQHNQTLPSELEGGVNSRFGEQEAGMAGRRDEATGMLGERRIRTEPLDQLGEIAKNPVADETVIKARKDDQTTFIATDTTLDDSRGSKIRGGDSGTSNDIIDRIITIAADYVGANAEVGVTDRSIEDLLADLIDRADRKRYRIQEGDSLKKIAHKLLKDKRLAGLIYLLNPELLGTSGNLDQIQLSSGDVLILPSAEEILQYRIHVLQDTLPDFVYAELLQHPDERIARRAQEVRPVYACRYGDSLSTIAQRHPGIRDAAIWPLIAKLNQLSDQIGENGNPIARLKRGQNIVIPSQKDIRDYRRRHFRTETNASLSTPKEFPAEHKLRENDQTHTVVGSQLAHPTHVPAHALNPFHALAASDKNPKRSGVPSTARVITTPDLGDGLENLNLRLEFNHEGEWVPVLQYLVKEGSAQLHIFSLKAGTQVINIDLPTRSVRELAEADLAANYETYCLRFQKGERPI